MEKWYLRSYTDGDTHCGRVSVDAMVSARCGVTFAPLPRLFGEGPAVVRPPIDPVAACPACAAAGEKTENADPDGVAVAGLVETLSSPRSPRKRFRLWPKRMGVNDG